MDVSTNLAYMQGKFQELAKKREDLHVLYSDLGEKQQGIDHMIGLNEESKEFYIKCIDMIYNRSLGKLEETINLGLSYVFYDKRFKIKIELNDKRGKSLTLSLLDEETQRIVNIKHGIGAGVRSVISFIFKVYYLISKGSYPLLLLDEAYSEISEDYIETFFNFMKGLCDKHNLIVVMITHDDRFMGYGDRIYSINDGNIKESGA